MNRKTARTPPGELRDDNGNPRSETLDRKSGSALPDAHPVDQIEVLEQPRVVQDLGVLPCIVRHGRFLRVSGIAPALTLGASGLTGPGGHRAAETHIVPFHEACHRSVGLPESGILNAILV